MYNDNHNDIYDNDNNNNNNNNSNNNKNQFDLSLFNVKSDDWRSRAYLKKAIVNIKTSVTSNKLMTFRGKIPLH